MKFYKTKEFKHFIEKAVIPGNGDNYYCLNEDGSVSEFTDGNSWCPAGGAVLRIHRNPQYKGVAAYIGHFAELDAYGVLQDSERELPDVRAVLRAKA